VSLGRLELAYHIGYVDRFCSASFQRLDLLAQVAGEIGAVSRLEVAK
jgi:hypothetical protein